MYRRKTHLFRRTTARLLVLILFWLGGVVALDHADSLTPPAAAAALSSAHKTLPPPLPCASCQWEQAVMTLAAQTAALTLPVLLPARSAPRLAAALHLRAFDHFALRAPPSLS